MVAVLLGAVIGSHFAAPSVVSLVVSVVSTIVGSVFVNRRRSLPGSSDPTDGASNDQSSP